ncbi:MAG: GNAT family N-acetyltransferase [Betaproteobacteria bacterium]|jgi:predicted N-acetyltransferase YhbS|nr:GNAT family N-acetyltransferase [Betaproteobacteria bacterium]
MDTVLIAQATREDAPVILALQHKAYQSEARLYNDWSIPPLTQTLKELEQEFQSNVVLKVIIENRLVGSVRACMIEGVVQIGKLIVEPGMQRQGIGGSLLQAIESAFSSAVYFELFTGSRSEGNIRFYLKHGYVITHQEVLSPTVTFVYMRKSNEAAA